MPVAVVAGAAPGLGAAIARGFVRAGYQVAGLSRGEAFGKPFVAEVEGYRHFICDVTDAQRVGDTLSTIERDIGPPSVLVYDPMKLVVKPFLELAPEEFESVWRVTCLGAMILARMTLPYMLAAGSGAILFTGATAAVKGGPRFASLASAKFALRGLAQSLAREFGPQGVHVAHVIIDGLIWGPQARERFAPERERCLEPEAIARTYVELAAQPRSAWTHELDLRPFDEKF